MRAASSVSVPGREAVGKSGSSVPALSLRASYHNISASYQQKSRTCHCYVTDMLLS